MKSLRGDAEESRYLSYGILVVEYDEPFMH
jgi:hypothetical protein